SSCSRSARSRAEILVVDAIACSEMCRRSRCARSLLPKLSLTLTAMLVVVKPCSAHVRRAGTPCRERMADAQQQHSGYQSDHDEDVHHVWARLGCCRG